MLLKNVWKCYNIFVTLSTGRLTYICYAEFNIRNVCMFPPSDQGSGLLTPTAQEESEGEEEEDEDDDEEEDTPTSTPRPISPSRHRPAHHRSVSPHTHSHTHLNYWTVIL